MQLTLNNQQIETEPYKSGKLRKRLQKHHGDNVDCAFWGWHDVWLSAEFRNWNIEYCLPTIAVVPTLVIQGADDHYGTLAQVRAIVKGIGDHAECLVLADCGHTPHRDQREMTLKAMREFIGRLFNQPQTADSASHAPYRL